MSPKHAILCDFDGTITTLDITNTMCRRAIPARWSELEAQWETGQISATECYELEYEALAYGKPEIDAFLDTVPVSPGIEHLLRVAQAQGWQFHILSAGFDYYIQRVLGRIGLSLPFTANNLTFSAQGKPQFRFLNHDDPACNRYKHPCSGCKPAIWQEWKDRGYDIAYIGDGSTDFCLADHFQRNAGPGDLLFAKARLLEYCRERGITARAWETLEDVARYLESAGATARP